MFALMSRMGEVQAKGTADMEFAILGLLARMQIKGGKAENAQETLENLKEKFLAAKEKRFMGNLNAALCRVDLYLGNEGAVKEWLTEQAPKEKERLRTWWRYQYLTKAMAEISLGQNDKALLTLAPLIPYCQVCDRTMDTIYIHTLGAIAHYRRKSDLWKQSLSQALDLSFEYQFITPIAQFGIAVLPNRLIINN